MKTYNVPVKLSVKITEEDINDIMVTAIEGGIGYWACLDNTSQEFENAPENEAVSETAARLLIDGKTITFFDEEEEDRPLEMNLDNLLDGIIKFFERGYDRCSAFCSDGTIDCTEIDSECADCIIQLALFDDIVYG